MLHKHGIVMMRDLPDIIGSSAAEDDVNMLFPHKPVTLCRTLSSMVRLCHYNVCLGSAALVTQWSQWENTLMIRTKTKRKYQTRSTLNTVVVSMLRTSSIDVINSALSVG